MGWMAWGEAWPDWKDAGRQVQTYNDGVVVTGKLDLDDIGSYGDGDEYPIWMIDVDGKLVTFADCEFWRFAPTT